MTNNPTLEQQAERAAILSLFPPAIYVETIPNQYCPQDCCKWRPWFVVTTSMGRIKIGWRKRVINIDWSDSGIAATADELFPSEDTTKYLRVIHAWGYDKAREYIARLLASESPAPSQAAEERKG